MAEILDISDGGVLRETNNGIEVDRIAVVTNVAGPADQYLKNALDTPGLPQLNDANPMYSGLRCRSREASDDGCGNVRIRLIYGSAGSRSTLERQVPPSGNNDTPTKNIGFTLTSKQVSRAFNVTAGATPVSPEDIVVQRPSTSAIGGVSDVQLQHRAITAQSPVGKIVFERLEQDPPLLRFRQVMGKVNDRSLNAGAYPRRSVLCSNITAQSPNDGDWWQVTYEFTFDAGTAISEPWATEVLWNGGQTSDDFTGHEDNVSRKQYTPYEEEDFEGLLNLSFDD